MSDELGTRTCAACGFPALAATRRCPFCREPFPRPPRTLTRPSPRIHLAALLMAAPVGLLLPAMLLAAASWGTLALLVAAAAVATSLAPIAFLLLLRYRAARRVGRYSARPRASGPPARGGPGPGPTADPERRSPDARRRG